MDQTHTANAPDASVASSSGSPFLVGLTMSAVMLVALIIMQLGRPEAAPATAHLPSAAQAQMVAVGTEYSMMTAQGPSNSYELVYVLNNRTGNLLVYEYAQPGRLVVAAQRFDIRDVVDRVMRGNEQSDN